MLTPRDALVHCAVGASRVLFWVLTEGYICKQEVNIKAHTFPNQGVRVITRAGLMLRCCCNCIATKHGCTPAARQLQLGRFLEKGF